MTETLVEVSSQFLEELQATGIYLKSHLEGASGPSKEFVVKLKDGMESLPLSKPKMRKLQTQVSSAIQDMGPVKDSPPAKQFLVEVYLWAAVSVLGFSLGQLVGAALSFIVGIIFNTGITVVISLALPIWYATYAKGEVAKPREHDRRMTLLGVSVALGIMVGHNFSGLGLAFYSPAPFVLPLTVGVASGLLNPELSANRKIFLGGTTAIAVAIYFLFGLLMRSLGFRYVLWVLAASAVSVISLQLQLGNLQQKSPVNAALCQLSVVVSSVLVEVALFYVFGTDVKNLKKGAAPKPKGSAPSSPPPPAPVTPAPTAAEKM